ncbi:hypothetical protein LOZ55_003959 [Ophidiomyces ophidiicola]|nr:hypothetical protein LOZ55_003959 [Ophidiomyces ophidiicola]
MEGLQNSPFLRELSSSDRRTRDEALDSLTLFLKSRRDLQLNDLLKIWKGLFFCMYHCDRPVNQQNLSRSLSYTLVPKLPDQILQPFLRAFWITMSRDFHSLDRLRLDKYLFLLRCYVGVALGIFIKKGIENTKARNRASANGSDATNSRKGRKRKRAEKNEELDDWVELKHFLDMLEEGPLCPVNFDGTETNPLVMPKGPDGIRYHIMDIWLDEIEKYVISSVDHKDDEIEKYIPTLTPEKSIPMELLLRPIERIKAKSLNKTARKRAIETLGDERLVKWGVKAKEGSVEPDDEEEEWGGIDY